MRIPMEDWLRGCAYHDGRHGEVTLSTDKVLEIANYIQLTRTSLTDGMIELPPYEPKDEPQPQLTANCDECQHYVEEDTADACYECSRSYTDCYEPQTEREGE